MKTLPLGIQTFSKIVESDLLYVDKTDHIVSLTKNYSYVFLSRPRRFGKSLLLSTINDFFSGNKELFAGLKCYDSVGESHPVIRLDFSQINSQNPDELDSSLLHLFEMIAIKHDVEIFNDNLQKALVSLVHGLKVKTGKSVVILIDEYDKPLIEHIENPQIADANRELLKSLFTVIKSLDEDIKFLFITGVSKFSKLSLFSGFNQITDITLHTQFNDICGISQEELETCFSDRIAVLEQKSGLPKEELLEKIKLWYNGYSWDGENRLYNPFSILNLFDSNLFSNYWFLTGTPSFLIRLITREQYDLSDLSNQRAIQESLNSDNLEKINLKALLFQTGYLTIKKAEYSKGEVQYLLDFPNFEVKDSLFRNLLGFLSDIKPDELAFEAKEINLALLNGDFERFLTLIKVLFANIPSNLYLKEEKYYHSIFIMILFMSGIKINSEVNTSIGRIDGVIETPNNIIILEFKYNLPPSDGLKQIVKKRYYEKFLSAGKEIVLVGVSFTKENIEMVYSSL